MNITYNLKTLNKQMSKADIRHFIQDHLNFFNKSHLSKPCIPVEDKCNVTWTFFANVEGGYVTSKFKIWLPSAFRDLNLNEIFALCLKEKDEYSIYEPYKFKRNKTVKWEWMPCTLQTLIVLDYLINKKYNV